MKKLLLLFLLACSCSGKNPKKESKVPPVPVARGCFKGNVFYTYNKYVGNRGDAGAHIRIYNLIDTSKYYDADADISGNFSIDSIPCASYITIITSKNVKDDPMSMMRNFYGNRQLIKMATGYTFSGYLDSLYRLGAYFDSLGGTALESHLPPARKLHLYDNYKDSVFELALKFCAAIPPEVRMKIDSKVLSKINFDLIEVKSEGVKPKVVDFGVTYI